MEVDRALEREPGAVDSSQEARELALDLAWDRWDRKALLLEFQVSRSKTLANPLDLFLSFIPQGSQSCLLKPCLLLCAFAGNCS